VVRNLAKVRRLKGVFFPHHQVNSR
jgi:hypothetical protein